MTTAPTYGGGEIVREQLRTLWQRRRAVRLAVGLCAVAATVSGVILIVTFAAGYWQDQPPTVLRWTLLIAAVAAVVAAVTFGIVRWATWRQNPSQNARYAEQVFGGSLDNRLINTLQLSAGAVGDPVYIAAAIDESVARVRALDMAEAVSTRGLRRWALVAAVCLLGLAAMAVFQGPRVSRAMSAVFRPGSYVPTVGSLRILSFTPRDAELYTGQSVNVVVAIDNDSGADHRARLFRRAADGGEFTELAMMPATDRKTHSLLLAALTEDVQYYVRVGDTRAPADREYYTITVIDRPGVAGLDATLTYPDYAGVPADPRTNIAGPIQTLTGTEVALKLRLNHATASAQLQFRGVAPVAMARGDGGLTYSHSFVVAKDTGYRISLRDMTGRELQALPEGSSGAAVAMVGGPTPSDGFFPIVATPDALPKVSFISPAPSAHKTVAPGAIVPMEFVVEDDYGLARARLLLGRKTRPDETVSSFDTAATFPLAGVKHAEPTHQLTIPADTPSGTILVYYAAATDNRKRRLGDVGPWEGESIRQEILVLAADQIAAAADSRFQRLQEMLMNLLRIQTKGKLLHLFARSRADAPGKFVEQAKAVAAVQQQLKAEAVQVLATFPFDAATLVGVKKPLSQLADRDMTDAIAQARVLASVADLAGRAGPSEHLLGTQDKILDVLQLLLAHLPGTTRKDDDPKLRQTPGGDLPPEHQEKLKDLAEQLDEFLDANNKAIAAAELLAKKPVDQLTEDDQKLLNELAATQDKWEKFLNEKFADFSKLAQQDFSNPSVLKELLSIKTDVTMAKDALSQPAKEVSTATDSMSSAGENAEELTANLEKWLPDTPDRTKWNMEDPGGQDNLELPELPSELEDLVGDLLEQEEDLFEEMADVTSKAADSMDKGIGWDAMDGPISSMNAQGVTGNQLPNPSEISGRSGEGRQGKSTGEFVQDEFVGKGGRRTPTRLTPEPFQTGEVTDRSTEPPGGSTGGGKISGAGGEGLEGPVPPPLAKELERLAGKQADLLNKAERIKQKFKATDYSGFDFRQGLTIMERVRDDLRDYRYQNALRRRESLLGALRSSREGLADESMQVILDTSSAVPSHIRQDISDAQDSPLPAEYRAALKSYLRKLDGGR